LLHGAESTEKCAFFAKAFDEKYLMRCLIKLTYNKISAFVFVLVFPVCVSAQRGPLRFSSPFQRGNCDSILLKTNRFIPDSSLVSLAPVYFQHQKNTESWPLVLAICNSGGLIAFSDSLLSKPILIEKRNSFPFRRFRPEQPLLLEYTCRPGPGGYLGFRLWDTDQKPFILDEILICTSGPDEIVQFLNSSGWIFLK
jgi:hypothetical protein